MSLELGAVWAVTIGVLMQGVWLCGLTYLMWRAQNRETDQEHPQAGTVA